MEDHLEGSVGIHRHTLVGCTGMREAQIWYSREHPDQRTLSSEFENVIVLSDEFYQELIAHPVPNDLEAVKVLAASPGRARSFHVAVIPMLHGQRNGGDSSLRGFRPCEPDRHYGLLSASAI